MEASELVEAYGESASRRKPPEETESQLLLFLDQTEDPLIGTFKGVNVVLIDEVVCAIGSGVLVAVGNGIGFS